MACFSPLTAYRTADGPMTFSAHEGVAGRRLQLRCGQCIGCRSDDARDWMHRIMHEASLHERNAFVTVTFDDDHLAEDRSLDPRGPDSRISKFVRKVQRHARKHGRAARYYHVAEYGEKYLRPHHHVIFFGENFQDDRRLFDTNDQGDPYWRSPTLDRLWEEGLAIIAPVTEETAAYCARYCMKKRHPSTSVDPKVRAQQEALWKERYTRIDKDTGETWEVEPEYRTMSNRPGIGGSWLDKYIGEVYPSDEVIRKGRAFRPPKYYDTRASVHAPELVERVKEKRRNKVRNSADYTEKRLLERERVAINKQRYKESIF